MIKNTTELKQGDIVVNQGMRILLDTPARVYEDYANGPVYAWPGLVLNADELCDRKSPKFDLYIYKHIRGIWWEDCVPRPRKDEWIVQGNHLATWYVEEADAR